MFESIVHFETLHKSTFLLSDMERSLFVDSLSTEMLFSPPHPKRAAKLAMRKLASEMSEKGSELKQMKDE